MLVIAFVETVSVHVSLPNRQVNFTLRSVPVLIVRCHHLPGIIFGLLPSFNISHTFELLVANIDQYVVQHRSRTYHPSVRLVFTSIRDPVKHLKTCFQLSKYALNNDSCLREMIIETANISSTSNKK